MKRAVIGHALVLAALGTAGATVVKPLSLPEQAKKAEVIIQAKVGAVYTQQLGGVLWNVYTLDVRRTLVGNVRELSQQDGQPALWVLYGVDDAPVFRTGEEAVLLLYRTQAERGPFDSPVVGFNQGVYRIRNGQIVGAQPTAPDDFWKSLLTLRGNK